MVSLDTDNFECNELLIQFKSSRGRKIITKKLTFVNEYCDDGFDSLTNQMRKEINMYEDNLITKKA